MDIIIWYDLVRIEMRHQGFFVDYLKPPLAPLVKVNSLENERKIKESNLQIS